MGASMGGYAALMFGSLTKTKALAFGPQTDLKADWDSRWDLTKARQTSRPELLDLAHLEHDADVYYCSGVEEDVRHAERLKARLHPQGCHTHAQEMRKVNLMKALDV
jgi:hypothetical protein